jgi:nucleotide-binding universal stress UspA family protein
MKTILVLTDFSKNAQSSGEMAIDLAFKTGANLLLFNAYISPPLIPTAEYIAWPPEYYTQIMEESTKQLKAEAQRLKEIIARSTSPEKKPTVSYANAEGSLATGVSTLCKEHHILLIVLSCVIKTSGDFLFGNGIQEVINEVKHPMLVLPDTKSKSGLQHLLFATDLDLDDMEAVKYLVNLAPLFNADVHICHVTAPNVLTAGAGEARNIFAFTDQVALLKSETVSYHNLESEHIVEELEKYGRHIHADLIAMVYKKHNIIWRLFHQNPASELLKQHNRLLLIFPPHFKNNNGPSGLISKASPRKRKRIPIL